MLVELLLGADASVVLYSFSPHQGMSVILMEKLPERLGISFEPDFLCLGFPVGWVSHDTGDLILIENDSDNH